GDRLHTASKLARRDKLAQASRQGGPLLVRLDGDRADREEVRDPAFAVGDEVPLELGLTQLLEPGLGDRAAPTAREHARQPGSASTAESLVDGGVCLLPHVGVL